MSVPRGASTIPTPSVGVSVGSVRTFGLDDLGVAGQLAHPLGRVDELDHPRPVVGQRVVDGLPAERGDVLLVGRLRHRRRHAVGGVEPRQRRHRVDAAVVPLDEPLPARRLEVGELHVAPRLDVLGDVVEVLRRLELRPLHAVGADDADAAVVEVHAVPLVHHPHAERAVRVGVRQDQVDVLLVLQHDLLEDRERELRELDRLVRGRDELGLVARR